MERLQQLVQIQGKVRHRQYVLTNHAEREREADRITGKEIEEALCSSEAEIIESYPKDVRGRSCLVLGFTSAGSPLHVVCGIETEELVVITVYRPDSKQWVKWRTRRKVQP